MSKPRRIYEKLVFPDIAYASSSARLKETHELISSELILRTAEKHKAGDIRVRSMPTIAFFWSLILSVEMKVYQEFYPAMAEMLKKLFGNDITKQGIQEQMGCRNWRWFNELYGELLKDCLPRLDRFEFELLKRFTDVQIADSTVISVVKTLRRKFRATTGDLAALKVHAHYSMKKCVVLKAKEVLSCR